MYFTRQLLWRDGVSSFTQTPIRVSVEERGPLPPLRGPSLQRRVAGRNIPKGGGLSAVRTGGIFSCFRPSL